MTTHKHITQPPPTLTFQVPCALKSDAERILTKHQNVTIKNMLPNTESEFQT